MLRDPLLLRSFLGNLPSKIREVISSAPYVLTAWDKCWEEVNLEGEDFVLRKREVFEFILGKIHNCRCGEYAHRASKESDAMRRNAGENMAHRLKMMASTMANKKSTGGGTEERKGGEPGEANEGAGRDAGEQHAGTSGAEDSTRRRQNNGASGRRAARRKVGEGAAAATRTAGYLEYADSLRRRICWEMFMSLPVQVLQEHVISAGGKGTAKNKEGWRNMLRILAPGIGWQDQE